jgi:hypothetical protein
MHKKPPLPRVIPTVPATHLLPPFTTPPFTKPPVSGDKAANRYAERLRNPAAAVSVCVRTQLPSCHPQLLLLHHP